MSKSTITEFQYLSRRRGDLLLVLSIVLTLGFPANSDGQNAGTGTLAGRILDADTGRPLGGVIVELSHTIEDGGVFQPAGLEKGSTGAARSAESDSQGRYSFDRLSPGIWRLATLGDGAGQSFGLSAPARLVTIMPGVSRENIDLLLRLSASISGRVTNPTGQPIVGATVVAVQRRFEGQLGPRMSSSVTLSYHVAARDTTDERGQYRLNRLPAGRNYYLFAHVPLFSDGPISNAPALPDLRNPVVVPAYYPNSPSIDTAISVRPVSLEARANVDIEMARATSSCLETTLTAAGSPVAASFTIAHADVLRLAQFSDSLPRAAVTAGRDGRIRACGLAPGEYRLLAIGPDLPSEYEDGDDSGIPESFGARTVVIGDRDVNVGPLPMEPSRRTRLELRWTDERRNLEPPVGNLLVRPRPFIGLPDFVRALARGEAQGVTIPGTLSFYSLQSVPQILEISNLDAGLYVSDILHSGGSIRSRAVEMNELRNPIDVLFADDAGSIRVNVVTESGGHAPFAGVLIVPAAASSSAALAATIYAGLSDESGIHVAERIPPGE